MGDMRIGGHTSRARSSLSFHLSYGAVTPYLNCLRFDVSYHHAEVMRSLRREGELCKNVPRVRLGEPTPLLRRQRARSTCRE